MFMTSCAPRGPRPGTRGAVTILLAAALLCSPGALQGQEGARSNPAADPLDALVAEALMAHPEIQGAEARLEASRTRIPGASALPDPMLEAGVMNLPLPDADFSAEGMTMLSLQLSQRLPPRGLRGARERVARAEVAEFEAEVELVRWSVRTRLQEAYFELLLVLGAEEVHHRAHSTLETFATAAESAYTQGLAPQQDVLRAQTELTAIEEHMSELRSRRSSALAAINAVLGRDSHAPVRPSLPPRLVELLDQPPGPGMLSGYLTEAELGAGYPTLRELQRVALEVRPELESAGHRRTAAAHRLEAAEIERRPGVSVMGGYGFRSARPNLLSLGIAVELPVFRSRKQDQDVAGARQLVAGEVADEEALRRTIRREVAEAHAELLRTREQVLLLEEGVLPQARAGVESAAAAYRSGEAAFVTLMEAHALLFRNEIQLAHLTAELGQALTRLERAVGRTLTRENHR
jgi:outer membrane protein, heavy metal efflux system